MTSQLSSQTIHMQSLVRRSVITAIVAVVIYSTPAAARQTPAPAPWWTSCKASETAPARKDGTIVLGDRTIAWKQINSPSATSIEVGSRIGSTAPASPPAGAATKPSTPSTGLPTPRADTPPAPPTELVFCITPADNTFPNKAASHALVLSVASTTEAAFFRVEVYRNGQLFLASDAASPQHILLLTSQPFWPTDANKPTDADKSGNSPIFVLVTREDAGKQLAYVTVNVEAEPLEHDTEVEQGVGWFVKRLSPGNAFRYVAESTTYEELLRFAQCDWVSHDARDKKEATVQRTAAATTSQEWTPPATAQGLRPENGCFYTQMDALKNRVYPFVSNLTGRSTPHEFHDGQPRAARSEPMIVFFGLGGLNKILLLDCRDTAGTGAARKCDNYAEPWQTTLQRARYVWAVYIEDEQTPFNTSIDVEFKTKAPSVDYEEYDPRGLRVHRCRWSPPRRRDGACALDIAACACASLRLPCRSRSAVKARITD